MRLALPYSIALWLHNTAHTCDSYTLECNVPKQGNLCWEPSSKIFSFLFDGSAIPFGREISDELSDEYVIFVDSCFNFVVKFSYVCFYCVSCLTCFLLLQYLQ